MIIKRVIGSTSSSTSQNPQVNQILIMQLFEDWSNAIKLGSKEVWSKFELACTVDEDDSHSKLLIDLLVTLRSIYHKQAIVTTHKQSPKRSEGTKKTVRKTSNQANKSCNRKQFLIVPILSELGLIRKFRSRASICKKNQLKRSYKTRVMNKKSLNSNLFEIKF